MKVVVEKRATVYLKDDYTLADVNAAAELAGAPKNTRFRVFIGGTYDNGSPQVTFEWSD